jgi:hypothetical protein
LTAENHGLVGGDSMVGVRHSISRVNLEQVAIWIANAQLLDHPSFQ